MLTAAPPAPSVTRLRDAVRASCVAVGLVGLSDHQLIETSTAAAAVLGVDPAAPRVDLATLTADPGAARQAISLIADGVLDACRIRTNVAALGGDDTLLVSLRAIDCDDEKPYGIAIFGAADDPPDLLSGLVEAPTASLSFTDAPAEYRGRLAELEQRLRRIASEIEAAGVVGHERVATDVHGFPGLEDLTERQREILARLLRGDRVPTISRGMHLATSTVRNHLTTVYRKVGVHSQAELIERLHSPIES